MSASQEQINNHFSTQSEKQRKSKQERGASLVEYALLVALIAVVAITAVRVLGRTVSGQFSVINATISG
jgi:Flp pilus assembly pilin Flp